MAISTSTFVWWNHKGTEQWSSRISACFSCTKHLRLHSTYTSWIGSNISWLLLAVAVWKFQSTVDPHAFGNGVLMPVMYQQMFQVWVLVCSLVLVSHLCQVHFHMNWCHPMASYMSRYPKSQNETVPGTSANGKKKRPRSQKPTEASQQSNGTPGPASG